MGKNKLIEHLQTDVGGKNKQSQNLVKQKILPPEGKRSFPKWSRNNKICSNKQGLNKRLQCLLSIKEKWC